MTFLYPQDATTVTLVIILAVLLLVSAFAHMVWSIVLGITGWREKDNKDEDEFLD